MYFTYLYCIVLYFVFCIVTPWFFLWHEGKFWPRSAQNFSIKLVYILFLINSELIDDIAMQILITSVAEVLIKHYIIYCSVCYVPKNLQVP